MQLEDVLNNVADQDRGRPLDLLQPWDGQPTGMRFTVAGPDSATARRARLELSDDLAEAADANGTVGAEAREAVRLTSLAKLVLRWEGVMDGDKTVAFNTKNLMTLLRVQWIQEQVDAFAGNRRNFSPAPASPPAASAMLKVDGGSPEVWPNPTPQVSWPPEPEVAI